MKEKTVLGMELSWWSALLGIHETLGSIRMITHKPGLVSTCDSRTGEVETGKPEIQNHLQVQFEVILGYVMYLVQNNKKKYK